MVSGYIVVSSECNFCPCGNLFMPNKIPPKQGVGSDKLIKSASVVGLMTLLSRISGLLRDIVFAHLLGDRAVADVFFVAFRIPNFFRRISAEGAFSSAFVPVFTDYRMHKSESDTQRFLQLLLGRFGMILFVASVLGVLAAPGLVAVLAPGFLQHPDKYQLAVSATRITFPYVLFISLVSMAAAMLNTCGRFAAAAATPLLLNICLISAALWFVPWFSQVPIALAVGVAVAGVVQLVFQIPFVRKEKLSIRPRIISRPQDTEAVAGLRQVFKLIVPAIFGVSVAQINVLINTLLASFLVTGSISWLYYSDRLMEFPVGVFGIALSTAILPNLSRQRANRASEAFSSTMDWATRWVCLICIPATAGLIALSEPMIATIYFHGGFTENGVSMAAASLVAYAVGLTAIVLVKILAPGFYAHKNTKTPVRIAMIAMATNIILSLALVYPLQHVGLALATSLAACVNAGLLYVQIKKENIYCATPGWGGFLLKVCVASFGMWLLLQWGSGDITVWLAMSTWQRAAGLMGWVGIGSSMYFVALWAMGLRIQSMRLAKHEA